MQVWEPIGEQAKWTIRMLMYFSYMAEYAVVCFEFVCILS